MSELLMFYVLVYCFCCQELDPGNVKLFGLYEPDWMLDCQEQKDAIITILTILK